MDKGIRERNDLMTLLGDYYAPKMHDGVIDYEDLKIGELADKILSELDKPADWVGEREVDSASDCGCNFLGCIQLPHTLIDKKVQVQIRILDKEEE